VKAPKFSYVRAATVEQVLTLIDRHGSDARILAGGQSLMPTLNMRLSQPAMLVDINRLDVLKGISVADGIVRIGALARHVEVMNSPIIAQHLPLIAEAMPHVAHLAVRNRGTFGGSVALADPAAEMPACALALQATMVVESVKGRRSIAAADYFIGLYETARKPNEMLVEVLIPSQRPDAVSVFMELARRHGDFAMAGVACIARFQGDILADARLVYFGSEGKPTLGRNATAALTAKPWSNSIVDAACNALAADLAPMKGLESEPAMLLHLQRVLTRRALNAARERSRTK
jgi:aerobic carbon-monoxide dehydrogenase medium subunit